MAAQSLAGEHEVGMGRDRHQALSHQAELHRVDSLVPTPELRGQGSRHQGAGREPAPSGLVRHGKRVGLRGVRGDLRRKRRRALGHLEVVRVALPPGVQRLGRRAC